MAHATIHCCRRASRPALTLAQDQPPASTPALTPGLTPALTLALAYTTFSRWPNGRKL